MPPRMTSRDRLAMVSQRAADGDASGDLVRRGAAFDGAEREHGGVERIDAARGDRLQRHDQMAGRHHRIARQMRHAGAPGMALDGDGDAPAGRP